MSKGSMDGRSSKRPNIVLFVAEDLDYEGLGCYDGAQTGYTGVIRAGNQSLPDRGPADRVLTPAIDRLASEGYRSENYYCASAICTPARYTILTGRYPERSPHFCEMYPTSRQANVFFNIGMTRDETNLAKVLQGSGYRTGMTGKWHNYPHHVKVRLADMAKQIPHDGDPEDPAVAAAIKAWYDFGVEYLRDGFGWDWVDRVYNENPEPFMPPRISGHNLEWIVEGALDFLEGRTDEDAPFFLYVPVTTPHSRYKGHVFDRADILATASGILDEAPRTGMMERSEIVSAVRDAGLPDYAREGLWLDEGVRVVLEKLEAIGKSEETCFIFTTDHPSAGKETVHMGRIPLIVRWPGYTQPGETSDRLICETDLAPTILDIAGCEIPRDMRQDGGSFRPLLDSGAKPGREAGSFGREQALLEVVNSRALVHGDWKYIANRLPEDEAGVCRIERTGWFGSQYFENTRIRDKVSHNADKLFPAYFEADQLYNLSDDPCEQVNRVDDPECADVLADLKLRMKKELDKLPHPFELSRR